MALRSHAEERHVVAVAAHGNVGRKFVQVMHKERCMLNNCFAEFGRGFPTVSCFPSATVLGIGGGQDVEIMRVLCALARWLKS